MYQHGTTLPMGGGGGGAGGEGVISFPGLKYLLYVDRSVPATAGPDGTQRKPFNTIGAALVAAIALSPSATEQIGIYCYPGVYAESGLGLPAYVHLIGTSRAATRIQNAAGPLVVVTASPSSINNLTLRALGANPILAVDGTAAAFTVPALLLECRLEGNNDNGNAIVLAQRSMVRFVDCQLVHSSAANQIFDVATTAYSLELYGCELAGFADVEGGDLRMRACHWIADAAYLALLTGLTDLVVEANVLLSPAGDVFRIGTEPAADNVIADNYFDCLAGSDALAVVGPGAVIALGLTNNVMVGGGIEGGFAPLSEFRVVGASGDADWYDTLTEAVASVDRDGVVIELHKDDAPGAAIAPPSYDFIVDGRNLHTITRAAGIFTLGADDEVILRRVTLVGSITLNGDGSRLTLEDSAMTGTVYVTAGDLNSWVILLRSSIVGVDQGAAIDISDDQPAVKLYWSYVKGAAGIPAIYWNAGQANPYVDLVSSTAMPGTTGVAASPFGRNAAQVITFSACQCAFENDPATFAGFTNDIAAGQQLNTLDVNADWV